MEKLQISLEAARVNAGLTQKESAELLGVDRSTVRRWEKGLKVPDVVQSLRLAEIYKIPMDNIFFGSKTRLKREDVAQ